MLNRLKEDLKNITVKFVFYQNILILQFTTNLSRLCVLPNYIQDECINIVLLYVYICTYVPHRSAYIHN